MHVGLRGIRLLVLVSSFPGLLSDGRWGPVSCSRSVYDGSRGIMCRVPKPQAVSFHKLQALGLEKGWTASNDPIDQKKKRLWSIAK